MAAKRVSWVELYLDLVFVLAVAQVAELLVADSRTPEGWVRIVLLLATFQLARLYEPLGAHWYLWLIAAWAVVCAIVTSSGTVTAEEVMAQVSGRGRRGRG